MAAKPIIAFREWGVEGSGDELRLAPRFGSYSEGRNPWETIGNARAFCVNETVAPEEDSILDFHGPEHRPGGDHCTCGLYGYYDVIEKYADPILHHLSGSSRRAEDHVYGVYIAWGEVTKHRRGLRSQYGRLAGLRWSPLAEELAAIYGVPLCDTAGELRAAGMRYGVMVDPKDLPAPPRRTTPPVGFASTYRGVVEQAALYNNFAGASSPIVAVTCTLELQPHTTIRRVESRFSVEGIDPKVWTIEEFEAEAEAEESPFLAGPMQVAMMNPGRKVRVRLQAVQREHLMDRALTELTKVGTIFKVERAPLPPPGTSNHGL